MDLHLMVSIFLYSGIAIVSSSSKSPTITEKRISNYNSKVITCESDSSFADIYWSDPDGKRIGYIPTEDIFSLKEENKSTLIIYHINRHQKGQYTCHKYDKNGVHYQEHFPLEKAGGPPEFDKKFEDITAEEGSDLEILCRAQGDPKPKHTWYSHVGMEIVEREGRLFVTNVDDGLLLTIKNVTFDLRGMYACNAENSHGMETKIHRLNVIGSTDSAYIDNAVAIEVTEDSVEFFLTITNTTAEKFQIYVLFNDSINETSVVWKPGDKMEVRNLLPSGKYDFRFRAGQFGRWSERYEVILLPAVPDVIVDAFGGGNLVLRFYRTSRDFKRGTIDKYRVTYTRLEIQGGNNFVPAKCNVSVEIPQCLGTKYVVAGLDNLSYYEVQVEAHTSAGFGKSYKTKLYVSRS